MISFKNYELSLIILEELLKKGIRQNRFGFNGEFSKNELNSITSLTLSGLSSLEELERLPELRSLTIYSYPTSNLIEFDTLKVNTITDFSILSSLTNLEELKIYNDNFITSLDISNLSNLNTIILFNNPNLKTIIGLDEKAKLKSIVLINNGLTNIGNIKNYILNTTNTPENILDVKLFPQLFGSRHNRLFLENRLKEALTNITFGEKITFADDKYILSYEQTKNMFFRALKILRQLNVYRGNWESIKKIHNHTAFNVEYDDEGLEYRNEAYLNLLQIPSDNKEYFLKRLKLMNTSYAAIVNKKAVCEGYVNMMRFILSIIDVETSMVNCSYDGVEFNHAAIKFKYNDTWYYADPERQRKSIENTFGYTLEEFKEIYNIPIKEQMDSLENTRGRV